MQTQIYTVKPMMPKSYDMRAIMYTPLETTRHVEQLPAITGS